MSRREDIVNACKTAMEARLKGQESVSNFTKNAKSICSKWQAFASAIYPDLRVEGRVSVGLGECFDIFDPIDSCVYELKVSGKNADNEFFKDLVKVYARNEADNSVAIFVFITEESNGKKYLDKPLPKYAIGKAIADGITVEIEYI